MKPEFQDLLNDNNNIINKICRAYTDNSEDFNDYKQECIVQLWKSFDSFRGASKISTWSIEFVSTFAFLNFELRKEGLLRLVILQWTSKTIKTL